MQLTILTCINRFTTSLTPLPPVIDIPCSSLASPSLSLKQFKTTQQPFCNPYHLQQFICRPHPKHSYNFITRILRILFQLSCSNCNSHQQHHSLTQFISINFHTNSSQHPSCSKTQSIILNFIISFT